MRIHNIKSIPALEHKTPEPFSRLADLGEATCEELRELAAQGSDCGLKARRVALANEREETKAYTRQALQAIEHIERLEKVTAVFDDKAAEEQALHLWGSVAGLLFAAYAGTAHAATHRDRIERLAELFTDEQQH